jgi:hypothetical protein
MAKNMFSMILAMTAANRHAVIKASNENAIDHSVLVGVLIFLEAVKVIDNALHKVNILAHWKYSIPFHSRNQAPSFSKCLSPADLPSLAARLPCASSRMSCHTAGGWQVRGCAELNRSKAVQKRCASCGSKGTFDFCLSFFSGKFLMRILRHPTTNKHFVMPWGCSFPRRIRRLRSRRTLTPSLGGARLRNCPNPNLDRFASHLCFFLFRETLWFVCLTLASSPSPYKTAPENSRR